MRRWLSIFIAILSLAAPAMAQTALSTTTCPGAGCDLETTLGAGTLSIQIVGTFTGTLQFEQSNDGATWVSLNVYAAGSTTAVTSATAAGLWNAPVSTKQMRIRFSAYTSGTATVYVSTTSARSSGSVFPITLAFPLLGPDGTTSAPTYAFASEPGLGMFRATVGEFGIGNGNVSGNNPISFKPSSLSLGSAINLGWVSTTAASQAAPDLILARGAADTLEQRRSTNPQTFNLYNSFTDTSNFERLFIGFASNNPLIASSNTGTGSARPLRFGVGGAAKWSIETTGHIFAITDNANDIGASGANRPRALYVATTGNFGTSLTFGAGSLLQSSGRSMMFSPSDGIWQLENSGQTTFTRLILGTNDATVNGASWNLNSGVLEAKTGDATAFTGVKGATVNATTAYQVAGVNRIYFVTADFTTAANTNLQTITGLVIPLPANTALNMPVRCALFYSQATAAVSDSFGIQTDTVTPSNIAAGGAMETALGTTAYGDATITNTTATAVVTGTPSATATVFNAYLDAFVENPSNASTTNINIMVKTSVSGDAITIKRGSFCRAF